MSIEAGRMLGERLMKVLGITGPVERIVVVADAREIARVYVQRVLKQDECAAIAPLVEGSEVREVASVEVSPDGVVTVKE